MKSSKKIYFFDFVFLAALILFLFTALRLTCHYFFQTTEIEQTQIEKQVKMLEMD